MQRALSLSTIEGYSGYGAEQGDKVTNFGSASSLFGFNSTWSAQSNILPNTMITKNRKKLKFLLA